MNSKKKEIKIKLVGFEWQGFRPDECIVYRILKKYYDVQICDDPDYLICSIFGPQFEYCKYEAIRIMCVGENYVPDFNLIDYAVSRYPIHFFDRNFYLIGCADCYDGIRWFELESKKRNYSMEFVEKKEFFANFIASHESEYNIRGDFFKLLSEYKRVESPGAYLNNMDDGMTVDFKDDSKTDFQRKCKFTLCFESTMHEGFITEKLSDAFFADTIPVYFGSTLAKEIFNEDAYIHCKGREDFKRTIDKIIELDNDNDKYLDMLRQPIFVNPHYPTENELALEEFVKNIIEQPKEDAYRRSRVYTPKKLENDLIELTQMSTKNSSKERIKLRIRITSAARRLLHRGKQDSIEY